MVIESQIGGVKQELDLIKVKRVKDDQALKEERAEFNRRIKKAERVANEGRDLVTGDQKELRRQMVLLRQEVQDMKGPLMVEVMNSVKENQALMRELGRTQTINRDIITGAIPVTPVNSNKEDQSELKTNYASTTFTL